MNQEHTNIPLRANALVDTADMSTLVAVIQANSFTGAARRLGISKSVVSRRITDMEHRLGTRLIDRTAARVSPTEVGAVYYAKCIRILESIESANDFVSSFNGGLRGTIRVLVPHAFCASVLAPVLAKFATAYPELRLEVELDEREDILLDSGFDVAIKIGRLSDSNLLARTLGHTRLWLCASPQYLQEKGRPERPEDLADHDCLTYANREAHSGWCLQGALRTHSYRVRERVRSGCYFQLLEAAKSGLGIGLLPGYLIGEAVRNGELLLLMADQTSSALPISAVYSSSRKISQKVQVFVSHLATHLANPAPWEEYAITAAGTSTNSCALG